MILTDFSINWEIFKAVFLKKPKQLLSIHPKIQPEKSGKRMMDSLYELIRDREIYLISEEIYDTYCYDEAEHYSSFDPSRAKKPDILYFFFWKNVSYFRLEGQYMLASEELTSLFRCHQQYISYSANALLNMPWQNIWKYLILK
jgi:methionine aminotransferase